DAQQLHSLWERLPAHEQQMPGVALAAARHLVDAQGPGEQARSWLLPIWQMYMQDQLDAEHTKRLFLTLQHCLEDLDTAWLQRIEAAQQRYPKEALLQYLGGMACIQRQLWGKAEQLLCRCLPG